ncbi:MAG: hypothetical protein HDT42_06155 [Ruminococcaceae bacterium]|nr:hypothetical protein [Oscillospiraceae bacterium]
MAEHSKNIKTLLELIKENPELPILPMVDSEIVGDGYGRWSGTWGAARVDRYLTTNDDWEPQIILERDYEMLEVLERYMTDDEFERLPDDETEWRKVYDSLPWTKAIIVNIDV